MLRAPHVKIPIQGKPKSEVLENLHESHSPPNLLPVNPTGNMTTLTSAIYSQIPAGEIGIKFLKPTTRTKSRVIFRKDFKTQPVHTFLDIHIGVFALCPHLHILSRSQ